MQKLYTKEGRALPDIPWEAYPRPQLKRDDWLCLNGRWELSFGNVCTTVCVPFCPESLLSGVSEAPQIGTKMTYCRFFHIPESWTGKRVLLHFGAVMRDATVLVNEMALCRHENGYLPFTLDVTEALEPGENKLSVAVVNDLDPRYPWGKQRVKRGGMWYTPCSGIWQTVWLEPVPEGYVRTLRITNGENWAEFEAEGVSEGEIVLDDGFAFPLRDGRARIELSEPHLWSPEDPYLYYFTLTSGEDRIRSYFALRTLTTETVNGRARLCLNGKPYFFNGLLDQGYWSDGLYTPAAPECYAQDILAMKALGFNTLRKHIKLEPEQFYYDCDRLGMVIFQDMVNNGEYRFLRDTLSPTLRLTKQRDTRRNTDPEARKQFLMAMEATAKHLGNHPSICLWTIFNEGWGQFCADEAYLRLKMLDGSRWIDATSGWFPQRRSDVESLHIYFGPLRLGRERRPQLLSEFGGYVWKVPAHSFNTETSYGYRIYKTREAFVSALQKLYRSLAPLVKEGLCGVIYTQVSDVEDETNGLLTYDRAVCKLEPEELKALCAALTEEIGS